MKAASPYLNFNGNTEEAFTFYESVFGGSLSFIMRYRDLAGTDGIPEDQLDKVAHIELPLGNGNTLMGADSIEGFGKPLSVGNNVYIMLDAESAEESERLFNALSDDGEIEMPLEQTEWADKFGMCTDKFGVHWMINYTGNVQFNGNGGGAS